MSFHLPRVNIVISDVKGFDSQGELSTLSIGFGLHQAWIYASMFGTSTMFSTFELVSVGARSIPTASITPFFLSSIIAFALTLLFIGITDQKFLHLYTSKRVLGASALVTSLGTFALFASSAPDPTGFIVVLAAGIVCGISSGVLIVFWGTAFARCSSSSIVLNSVLAIVFAMIVYGVLLYVVPNPFAGILTALLPLAELPFLWMKTPQSYILRHEVPIFQPLPVKKGVFSLRFGIPVLLAGFALGSLRSISTQVILPSPDLSVKALIIVAASILVLAVLLFVLFTGMHRYWDSLFRVMIPLVLLTLCFIPVSVTDNSLAASIMLIAGYMYLEALMWIFFGQLCQTFRLSSAFVFGIGRGVLALGSLAGTLTLANTEFLDALTPFGPYSGILFYMGALVIAYMFLPRVRDIKRMIDPSFEHRHTPLDDINDEMDELDAVVRDKPRAEVFSPLATIADSGRATLTQAEADNALETIMSGDGELIDADTLHAIDAANAQHTFEQEPPQNDAKKTAWAAGREAPVGSGASIQRQAAGGKDANKTSEEPSGGSTSSGTDSGHTSGVTVISRTAAATGTGTVSGATTARAASACAASTRAGVTSSAAAAHVPSSSSATAASAKAERASASSARISSTGGSNGSNDSGVRKGGRFRTQCETIANRYLLSRRETEVLFLLAKGHNAAYIQKKLCITQSTAKTHIYHIYQKLDIHTQQELLAMVSDGEDARR